MKTKHACDSQMRKESERKTPRADKPLRAPKRSSRVVVAFESKTKKDTAQLRVFAALSSCVARPVAFHLFKGTLIDRFQALFFLFLAF